jgi:uncharacterized protein YndB with AHSA1/START domain
MFRARRKRPGGPGPHVVRREVRPVTTIERSIRIDAPLHEVFAYVDDPVHLPEIWPSLVEVKEVETLPKGGHRYHWRYKMAGMHFEGDSETVEYELDRHCVYRNTGQIASTFDWTFTPEDGATRISTKTEYEIPQKLLGKLAEPLVRKLNEREADIFLGNLKDMLEA